MTYFFDYGIAKENQWFDGIHQKEQYDDGSIAFARYLEIQRKGKRTENELRDKGMLPEGNRFLCTLDIRDNKGNYNYAACMQFFFDAFAVLNEEQIQIQSSELTEPQ